MSGDITLPSIDAASGTNSAAVFVVSSGMACEEISAAAGVRGFL